MFDNVIKVMFDKVCKIDFDLMNMLIVVMVDYDYMLVLNGYVVCIGKMEVGKFGVLGVLCSY